MRKCLSAPLVLLLLVTPFAQAQFSYTTNNGGITINGYTGTNSSAVIPDFISGLPVTAIGETAFQFSSLESVTVGSNVTSLGAYAFAGSGIASIYFDGNAPSFGQYTFFLSGPTIYYNYGTTGWGTSFDGLATVEVFPDGASFITVGASPVGGGAVTGAGRFGNGFQQTVTAIAASNYTFVNWSENGNLVSTSTNFTFTLTSNMNLVANFNGGIGGTSRQISFQTLNDPAAVNGTYAQSIDGGNVVGYYKDNEDTAHGFFYNGITYTTLNDPNAGTGYDYGTYATGVSGNTIVGYYYDTNGIGHGFIYASGIYSTLDDPNAQSEPSFEAQPNNGTFTQGISGTNIVGYYADGSGTVHSFIYNGSAYLTLNAPIGNDWTFAQAISGGNIVGYYSDANTEHGFVYTNDAYITVDNPNADNNDYDGNDGTFVESMSGANIAGYYWGSNYDVHGFVYIGGAYVTVDAPNGVGATYVTGISGTNIVGHYGTNSFVATVGPIVDFTLSAVASPSAGGTISGVGTFTSGTSQTVTATPNSGYTFADWSVNGSVVSLSSDYNFTLGTNLNLVANFSGGVGGNATRVSFQTLYNPNGIASYPRGISGDNIVGDYVIGDINEYVTLGFLYNNGSYTTLVAAAPNEDGYTSANGIDGTNIVGSYIYLYDAFSIYPATPVTAAFLYSGGTYTLLSDPASENGVAGTWAQGISGNTIVGYYFGSDFKYHGFIYTNGNYGTLDEPNATSNSNYFGQTWLTGISGGNIVGYYSDANDTTHGFFYDGTNYTTLDDPNADPYYGTYATGVSGGNVVGWYTDFSQKNHGFFYTNGTYTTLDDPNGVGTQAFGISGNTVVGSFSDGNYGVVGFIATLTTGVDYMIAVDTSPSAGGTATGGGTFDSGSSQTVTATANSGYTFANWTENGSVVSSSAIYDFTLNSNLNLVANFSANAANYTIAVGASPSSGGIVSGAGTFASGSSRTVTARANSGYTFADWTENGSVVSSSPSYTLTLNANQTLVASFAIKGNPKLAITSPKASQSVSNALLLVTGTVTDKVPLEGVYYQLNEDGWTLATPGNSWSNWTASVTLNPGVDTLSAYAVDTSGTFSPTNSVAFKFIPSAALSVQTNGLGSITPVDNGKLLAIGTNYTLTASPAKNWLFSNWVASGGENFVSNNPVLKFTMQSNLVLTANFVTNLFLAAQGAYHGLFAPTGVLREQTDSGAFTLNLLSTGAFSGDLFLGSNTVSLAGKFDISGHVQTNSPVKGGKPLTTVLQLDVANQAVSGTVSDGSFVAQLDGDQNVFGPSHPATDYAGQYTWTIPGTNNALVGPYGTSYGTITVSADGDITFAGNLADGTTVSQSSAVSKGGLWPMYLPSSNPNESVFGWNYFTNQTLTAPALVSWINVTNKAKSGLYPSGFTNQEAAIVASYYNPTAKPLLSLTEAQVTLEGGGLPFGITNQITLEANNVISVPATAGNTNKLKLTITPKTALITGSFQNPVNAKQTITLSGVLLQNQTNAQGFFLGTNQSGAFLLQNP